MGKNNLKSGDLLRFLLPMIALAISGCILPDPTPFPTPTPRQVITVIPSPTPTPRPTAIPTATPVPTETPVPSPTPTDPVQVQCSIDWRWVDNELIIVEVDLSRADGLAPGDRIIAINGRLSLEVILEAEKEIGGGLAPEDLRRAAVRLLLVQGTGKTMVLLVQHNGEPQYFFNLRPGCH